MERSESQRHTIEIFKKHLDLSRGNTHIQVLDAPAVCNTDHYLVLTNDREGLSVGKEGTKALIRKDSIRRS